MSQASKTVPETKSETPKTALDHWVTWMRSSYFWVMFVAVCSCIAGLRPMYFLIFPPVFVMALWGMGQVAKAIYFDKLDRALDEHHMKTQKVTVDEFLKYFYHVQKHRLYIASASLISFLLCAVLDLLQSPLFAYGISLAVAVLGSCLSCLGMHRNEISTPEDLIWKNKPFSDDSYHARMFHHWRPGTPAWYRRHR